MFHYSNKQNSMYVCFLILGVVIYIAMLAYVHLNYALNLTIPAMIMATLLASPITFAALAYDYETLPGQSKWTRVRMIFNPKIQSWAFLADIFALTPVMAIAVHGWHRAPNFANQWWWYMLVAPIAGFTGAMAFHFGMDAKGYTEHNPTALLSPTKVWHNWVTYPVLFSAMIAVAFPYLWVWDWHAWTILTLVLVWVAGGAYDGVRKPALDPRVLHIPWNPEEFRPLV